MLLLLLDSQLVKPQQVAEFLARIIYQTIIISVWSTTILSLMILRVAESLQELGQCILMSQIL